MLQAAEIQQRFSQIQQTINQAELVAAFLFQEARGEDDIDHPGRAGGSCGQRGAEREQRACGSGAAAEIPAKVLADGTMCRVLLSVSVSLSVHGVSGRWSRTGDNPEIVVSPCRRQLRNAHARRALPLILFDRYLLLYRFFKRKLTGV